MLAGLSAAAGLSCGTAMEVPAIPAAHEYLRVFSDFIIFCLRIFLYRISELIEPPDFLLQIQHQQLRLTTRNTHRHTIPLRPLPGGEEAIVVLGRPLQHRRDTGAAHALLT